MLIKACIKLMKQDFQKRCRTSAEFPVAPCRMIPCVSAFLNQQVQIIHNDCLQSNVRITLQGFFSGSDYFLPIDLLQLPFTLLQLQEAAGRKNVQLNIWVGTCIYSQMVKYSLSKEKSCWDVELVSISL